MSDDFEDKLAEVLGKKIQENDAKADSFLDKIKAYEWTPLILVGVVALIILAWLVG
jgi:hypothetical protein